MNFLLKINIFMILFCVVVKVVNGKSFYGLSHQTTDEENSRIIQIPMQCPINMRFIDRRCRKIYTK